MKALAKLSCLLGLPFVLSLQPAQAATVTASFTAVYNPANVQTYGDLSDVVDFSAGLTPGETIHGTFSYDPALSPSSGYSTSVSNTALYNGASLSFTLGGTHYSFPTSSVQVSDSFDACCSDTVYLSAPLQIGASFGSHTIENFLSLNFYGNPGAIHSTTIPNLPGPFSQITLQLESDDVFNSSGNYRGYKIVDLTVTDIVTPAPAALPLFASGLGLFGLAGWRRKRKAQRPAA